MVATSIAFWMAGHLASLLKWIKGCDVTDNYSLWSYLSYVCIHGLTGSAVGHRSIAPGFKSRLDYIIRMFHLSLLFSTVGGRSGHLAYLVHKRGHKTATVTCSTLLSLT